MKKFLISALAVFITAGAVSANNNELNVYPVPAVFNSQNINDTAFNKVLTKYRDEFISIYLKTFDKYFTNTNKEINEASKYKTFAAYVHVPRASQYHVKKSDTLLDIYLPLTMSINFVNMATGETLYSYPFTNYYKYETTFISDVQQRKAKVVELCRQNYKDTLEEIVKHAGEEFKPFDITSKITDSYKGLYVLDKGLESGIAKDDTLTDQNSVPLKVIYSDLNYSVAKPLDGMGKPTIGSSFSKFTNESSLKQLKKPKVLFLNDFGDEKLYNLFASALGNNAEFSLITTDKTYYDMQSVLVSLNNNFSTSTAHNRTLPDYFLKLYFTHPAYAQYKSNKAYYNVDKYEMITCGVIFDKAGRVVYSSCADDEMTNQVIGDVRFNNEANTEIIAKNSFNKLAASMQKDIQFKNVKFKITNIDDKYLTLADPNGFLKAGNILTVYKKVKTEKNGQEILIPTWDYKVIRNISGTAECKQGKFHFSNAETPSKKDIIQTTAMTRSANKAKMFNYYPDKTEVDGNGVHLKSFESIAFAAMASSLKAPVAMHPADFEEQINELNSYGFKDKIQIKENKSNLTIKAVYKVNLKSQERKGTALQQTYDVIVGIVSKNGEEVIKKDGLMQTITIHVPKENNEDIIENELMKFIYPLIQQVASNF